MKKFFGVKKYYDDVTNTYKHNVLIENNEENKELIEKIYRQCGRVMRGFNNKDMTIKYLNAIDVFEFDENIKPTQYIAYVDGSFNVDNNAGSSCSMILKDSIVINVDCKKVNKSYISNRNIGGELLSVLNTLKYCSKKNIKEITIYFDCMSVYECLLQQESAKDSDVIKYYKRMMQKYLKNIKAIFIHTKSHQSNKYNILVDFISKSITLAKKSDSDKNNLKDMSINVKSNIVETLKQYLQDVFELLIVKEF